MEAVLERNNSEVLALTSTRGDGEGDRKMEVLDPSGHAKHIWDSESKVEVEAIRNLYDSLTAKGYKAWHVNAEGEQSGPMKKFDPSARKMIMTPPIVGG